MNNKFFAASALAVAFAAQPVLAASLDANLGVSATVEASCAITTSPVSFGTIGTMTTGSSDVLAQGSINVTCTSDAPYYITLGNGLNLSAGSRRLRNVGATIEYLTYGLFTTLSRDTEWGSEEGVDTVSGTGDNTEMQHAVYGTLESGQPVSLGLYQDTVVATVWYGDLT